MRVFERAGWIWLLLAACWAYSLPAQPAGDAAPSASEFIVQAWRTSDGLPANVILDIAQTPDGYLWLATTHGLVRFDGVRFESYLTSRLPHRFGTRIEALDVDSNGRLWIVTEQRGFLTFYNGRFEEFHTNAAALKYPTTSIRAGAAGEVWVSDLRGHLASMADNNPARLSPVEARLPSGSRLIRDGTGNLWAASARNVSRLISNKWVSVLRTPADVAAVGARRGDGLWLAMTGRLHQVTIANKLELMEPFPWDPGTAAVTCLHEDSQGTLWLGTSTRGLYRRHGFEISQALAVPRAIKCLAEDSEGNLWVGARGGGLARVRKRVFRMLNSSVGLSNEYVNTVAEDFAGRIWLATEEQGFGWVERNRWQPVGQEQGWPEHNVFCVAPGREQDVWVATVGQGLWHWSSNRFSRVTFKPRLPGAVPRCLHQARDGRLWLVLGDVGLVAVSKGRFTRHGFNNGLQSRRVRALAEDIQGGIWAGDYHGGIWRLIGPRWQEVRPPNNIADAVRAMLFDPEGTLWVGTAGGGMMRIQDGQTVRITREHGLPGNEIEQMLLDGGVLWLGTVKGLFHISLQALNELAEGRRAQIDPVHHGQSEGLPELHFAGRQQPRCWRTQSGELWFSTANGALHFKPSDLPTNGPPPRVLLESVLVNGRPVPPESLRRLKSDARRLEFRFTAPVFSAPERVRFRYQFEGVDDTWVECGSARTAAYASIPFGTHVFRVAARNASGEWGPAAESAAVVVQPFFWQTQWFVALVAATLAGGLAWAARRATMLRLRRRLKRLEQQHALERERARISRDIHDELGANLTSIGLLADMGVRHKSNPEALTRDLAQISETARGTATAMDAIVWAVNPRNDSLDHFANYIGQFTKDFFRPTTIRTRLDLPASLPPQPMSANVRHNLFLAVKEALNNVVRHAQATEVRLILQTPRDGLVLIIEDNGKGMPATETIAGQDGLSNMGARIQKLGGSLLVQPGTGGGTRITFTVPLLRLDNN